MPSSCEPDQIYFSVVIPLFNKAPHIQRTLESVLTQTYRYFEIVIVDDGSTDHGPALVAEIADWRIRMIQQPNGGVSSARNRGVELAKHDNIAFLDADDEWEPRYLEVMASMIDRYAEARFPAPITRSLNLVASAEVLSFPGLPAPSSDAILENYFVSAMRYTPLWTSATVVRRDTFLSLAGFVVDTANGEDLDLWCRAALKYHIAYRNEPLANYRRDSQNMLSREATPTWFPFLEPTGPPTRTSSLIIHPSTAI